MSEKLVYLRTSDQEMKRVVAQLMDEKNVLQSRIRELEAELAIEREDRGLLCFADNAAARLAGAEAALRWAYEKQGFPMYLDEYLEMGLRAVCGEGE